MKVEVNKKLLPIKGHFFLFNAGTAPLVPYLSTYARQLGFSSATVGVIYTVLPIFGLIAKPFFGWIADKFKIQKTIFIIFEIITILGFGAIYFIPEASAVVELECADNMTRIKACYSTNISGQVESLKLSYINKTYCKINCDMTSPNMQRLVCQQLQTPQYCSTSGSRFKYVAQIGNVTADSYACFNASVANVMLDGYPFEPSCREKENNNNKTNCRLKCPGVLHIVEAGAQCINNSLSYRICPAGDTFPVSVAKKMPNNKCEVDCDIRDESYKSEICEEWQAYVAPTCQYNKYVSNISFTANLMVTNAEFYENCLYFPLLQLDTIDNTTYTPNCMLKNWIQSSGSTYKTKCSIKCNELVMNEILQESSTDTQQFALFFLLMIINWIGQAVVVTFADAICFNLLGPNGVNYGKQRLWGSIGWGIFSLLTGTLIDMFSEGVYKDYTIAFVLMFVFLLGDVIVSCFLQVEQTQMSFSILQDVGLLMTSLPTVIFFLWTIAVGMCTGLLWNFLFWHIEDIAATSSSESDYVKTLQGLVSAIQAFCGEIPFLFLSGCILKKFEHVDMMSFVLLAFGVRFLLYSAVTNAWWILPIELFQGITFGMFYPTMTSYASVVAPQGTETTVQGLVGAIFEGVGVSLGSLIGGQIFEEIGGWHTFRWFGCGALVACVLHYFIQRFVQAKMRRADKYEA